MPRPFSGFLTVLSRRQIGAAVLVTSIATQAIAPVLAAPARPFDDSPSVRPTFALPQSAVSTPSADPMQEWNKEIADARLRRSKARHLQAAGYLLAFGGDILANVALRSSCNYYSGCSSTPAVTGLAFLLVGVPIGIVGGVRAHDADGEVNALLVRKPQTSASIALPAGANRSIDLTLGQTNAVSYRIKW